MEMDLDHDGHQQQQQQQHEDGNHITSNQTLSVVIDAANVCWHFITSQPGWINVKSENGIRPPMIGLVLCIQFWRKYGIDPVAICPSWWTRKRIQNFWGSAEWEENDFVEMENLRQGGYLFCSPSGEHDDIYLIDYTYRTDGFLISNDKYRDHLKERDLNPAFIEERRIGYMFVKETFLPNPDDLLCMENLCRKLGKRPGASATHSLPLPPPQHMMQYPQQTQNNSSIQPSPTRTPSPAIQTSMTIAANHPTVSPSPPLQHMIDVPDYSIKHIIGRGGSKINEIRDETHTQIDIDKHVFNGRQKILVVGSQEGVQKALDAIHEIVQYATNKIQPQQGGIKIATRDPVGYSVNDRDNDL